MYEEVNAAVLGRGWNCYRLISRFEIIQLLFADDTALLADSEEMLCRLVSESGRVCKIRKLSECG